MQYCREDWRALWGSRGLLWVMTRRELKSRYVGSALGMLWAYLQPLLMVGAYFLVFDVVFAMRMGEGAPTARVGTYLVVGALPWLAFCEALQRGASSLVEAGPLLQKNALPPVLFVARSVLAGMAVFGPLMVLLTLVYLPISGVVWPLMALPILLLLQGLLAYLLAHTLAIMAAALRDVLQVLGFMLMVGVYLSPVLFPISLIPAGWRWLLYANPMSALVMGYQAVMLKGEWPGQQIWLVTVLWILVSGLLLNALIRRSRDELVDWL